MTRPDDIVGRIDAALAHIAEDQRCYDADAGYRQAFRRLCAAMEADGRRHIGDPWGGRPPLSIERYDLDARLSGSLDDGHRRAHEQGAA